MQRRRHPAQVLGDDRPIDSGLVAEPVDRLRADARTGAETRDDRVPRQEAQHEEHEGGRGYQQEDAGSHAPDDEPEHRSVAAPARQPLFAALSMWSWPPPSTQAPDTLFLTADAICAWSGTQIGTSVFSIF